MDRRAPVQTLLEQETGTFQPLGQIVGAGGTAINNHTTATPFIIPLGARLALQLVVGTLPVAWVATPDVDSGAALTAAVTGVCPQFTALYGIARTCLFGGGGQGTGVGQGAPTSATAVISVESAAAFTVNVFRLR